MTLQLTDDQLVEVDRKLDIYCDEISTILDFLDKGCEERQYILCCFCDENLRAMTPSELQCAVYRSFGIDPDHVEALRKHSLNELRRMHAEQKEFEAQKPL